MDELVGAGIIFIVLAVSLMIGGAIIVKTENITLTMVPGNTLISQLASGTAGALSTMASLLPIIALALVGGLSIFYLMTYMGRTST